MSMGLHPSQPPGGAMRLYGRRIMMRPLGSGDFAAYSEVRRRNHEWLVPWEPARPDATPDPAVDRDAFGARCTTRQRERQLGHAYAFGLFVDSTFAGEININNIQRGALQCCTIGYWIDQARAGNAYVAEGVVVALRFAFEEMHLHRVEICIIPRNERSHAVMKKLAIRDEGLAVRYVEIAGVWEDHVRYGITAEEWQERRASFAAVWL
jgi:ribosomal-protein-alanine N-acetyltransferase